MKPPPGAVADGASRRDPVVASLEERTGVAFADPALALAALTHKSYVNEHRGETLQDNERLEFLGDAVIDLAVSHRLMERFPAAREGELSKIRAALVDEAALSRIARDLDLGDLLRLGRGEELTGGRQKSSLLADALEAVVAAVYLGGGLGPVLTLVDRFLGEAFARAAAGTLDRDYKTQLQELAQSRMRATPRYRVVAEHGPDHSKVFDVELEVRGEVVGRGAGRSKKDAEQAAAKRGLEVLGARGDEARANGTAAASEAAGPAAEVAASDGVGVPVPGAVPVEVAAPVEAAVPVPIAVAATVPVETADAVEDSGALGVGDGASPAAARPSRPRRPAAKKRAPRATRAAKAPAPARRAARKPAAKQPARKAARGAAAKKRTPRRAGK
jgi:ribonuclease-3